MAGFNQLPTVKFQIDMKPHALEIYQRIFPGCHIQDLREQGVKVHVLDKEFGIDSLCVLKSGQWFSIQEKYREFIFWQQYRDFTQEYKNADGTEQESPGEWFKLGAQLYFYGWANETKTAFYAWLLLNIPIYKQIIENIGGIERTGKKRFNYEHGRASFYGIPLSVIKDAIIFSHLPGFNFNKPISPLNLTPAKSAVRLDQFNNNSGDERNA